MFFKVIILQEYGEKLKSKLFFLKVDKSKILKIL